VSSVIHLNGFHKRNPVKMNLYIIDGGVAKLSLQSFSDSNGKIPLELSLQNHHSKLKFQFISSLDTQERTVGLSELKDIYSVTLDTTLDKGDF
jgi:hypothetical protein